MRTGTVWFVGAGPGDPELITVKGRGLVERAGAILFAGSLVSEAATRWGPAGCVVADSKDMTLEQMSAWLVEQAGRCDTVVRLQTGDPGLYGALIELVQPLDAAGVPIQVVPGVSSAMASAAAAVESLTLPEVTQTVIFTRVEGRTPMPEGESLQALAAHHCTLCIFLSITLLGKVTAQLLAAGWSSDAPVVVVHKASWPGAREGKKVALISSGDAGVYGMAGPTYEVLFQAGWTPESDVEVEVVPGASAINACAALVGAPLTHDFCSISLSDLLTPWPVIARRLDAVAAADFVVALYNPKSGRRTQQIVQAQRLFLRHRRPDTPVAVVKSAYRRRERIEFTTLDKMSDCDIGMLTTVLIGNSNTFIRHGLMVTPRGYANKYELHGDGSTLEGEKPGRSLSTGLLGWMENLRTDHADGESITALALRHKLPADYIEVVLMTPVEQVAVKEETASTEESEA